MLRDFQHEIKAGIYQAWNEGARNVMAVSPTGSGKTVVLGAILKELQWPACAIAHRQELVGQIALALNREGVPHGIIAPPDTVRQIVALEMDTHGVSHWAPRADIRVAGVDTLPNRDSSERWFKHVRLVVQDEGHHVLRDNKWGKAMALFPSAYGLFPTAHAVRADGAGLGRAADGLVDRLVLGPSCRNLINRGFLTDYRLVCPPSDVDISDVPVSTTGDFSMPKLRAAVHRSKTIVGDAVKHYLKFAPGKLGITFAVDIEAAGEISAAYKKAGIPAEVITAKTPTHIRALMMRKFRAREILQLVSVDVLGEGVDVPAIEVISLLRHTASFQVYSQQFGRSLRLMVAPELDAIWHTFTDEERLRYIAASGKPSALIIDHVSNYERHGLPDRPREYTLERRERRSRPQLEDVIPLRTCLNPDCLQPYERFLPKCPYCATVPAVGRRGSPELVEGDLIELDPEVLRKMRGEIERIDGMPRIPENVTGIVAAAIKKRHWERQQAQAPLRNAIALWAGYQKTLGRDDAEIYKRFWHGFGVDVMTAQTLGSTEATELHARIATELQRANVVAA